jgi:prefoldin alpha subunit
MEENIEQELARKFHVFEHQIRMLQEQMNAVEQATMDLQTLDFGLDDLKDSKDREILAQVGRGIFVKAKITGEELLVDIGNKNFVTKSIENTKEVLKEQIEKLNQIKEDLESELDKINTEITNAFLEHQGMHSHEHNESSHEHEEKDFGIKLKSEKEKKKECDCDEDCAEHGEDCHCHDGECHCGHEH